MTEFLNKVFQPPPFPAVDLGNWAKVSGTETMLREAFTATYFSGVREGLIAGVALGVIVVFALILWRSPTVQKVTTNVMP